MDSRGFSWIKPNFPAGLRVLAVDDDVTFLKILERMLKNCHYEVTTCSVMQDALDLLRERKDAFDLIMSDVNMPGLDGFKLLEQVCPEMEIPVIMMSIDGDTSRVMKGVQYGACDYLLKPIKPKDIRNIWQHVFRKRMHQIRSSDNNNNNILAEDGIHKNEQCDNGSSSSTCPKKRKDADDRCHDSTKCANTTTASSKKARVVWTADLHQKFVKAVNQIGLDRVGPKKILDLMGVSWLSRENVASHLQKYRLYLSRTKKENELKAARSFSSNENLCYQSLISQSAVPESYTFQGHSHDIKICEGNGKGSAQQEFNPHFPSEDQFDHYALPISCIQVDAAVSYNPRPSGREVDESNMITYGIEVQNNAAAALFPVQPQTYAVDSASTYNHMLEQNLYENPESSHLGWSWSEQFNDCPSQGDFCPPNRGLVSFECDNQELIVADVPVYNSEHFDCQYSPIDNPGSFIA